MRDCGRPWHPTHAHRLISAPQVHGPANDVVLYACCSWRSSTVATGHHRASKHWQETNCFRHRMPAEPLTASSTASRAHWPDGPTSPPIDRPRDDRQGTRRRRLRSEVRANSSIVRKLQHPATADVSVSARPLTTVAPPPNPRAIHERNRTAHDRVEVTLIGYVREMPRLDRLCSRLPH